MKFSVASVLLGLTSVGYAQPTTWEVAKFCPNAYEVIGSTGYPRAAVARNLASGEVVVAFTVTTDDQVADIVATESTHPIFEEESIRSIRKLRCKSGGEERHLRTAFSYRFDVTASYVATQEDIPDDRLIDVAPQIAELRVTPDRVALRSGDGLKIDTLKVLAYDRNGKLLGRLRQFDRGAQPKEVLAMRGAGIVQSTPAGVGFVELSVPLFRGMSPDVQRPTARVEITVSE